MNLLYSFAKFIIISSISSLFIIDNLLSLFGIFPSIENILIGFFLFFDNKLQLNAILYAVDILSPVSIHIFIFDNCNDAIVSFTSSCNLSSTIVAPNKVKFISTSDDK